MRIGSVVRVADVWSRNTPFSSQLEVWNNESEVPDSIVVNKIVYEPVIVYSSNWTLPSLLCSEVAAIVSDFTLSCY